MVAMDSTALRQRFMVPGVTFDEASGLTRVHVDVPEAKATIYLQGAHLTAWEPAGFEPVILLSHASEFGVGKAIRGGVPVVFPWFAGDTKRDRVNGHPGPSHGFARVQDWTLESVKREHDAMVLTFTLGPTEMSRTMGFAHFGLSLVFHIGRELDMQLTVTNTGDAPFGYEEAFHTYFEVADIHEVSIDGLEPTSFIDKTDGGKVKPAAGAPIRFTETLDRVYNSTAAALTIHDVAGRRRILVRKSGSNTTVVWNPWKALPDLAEWDWHEMVAVETANVGENAIELAAQASSTMGVHVRLEPA